LKQKHTSSPSLRSLGAETNAKESSSSAGASPGGGVLVDTKTTESPERTDFTLAILADMVKKLPMKDSFL